MTPDTTKPIIEILLATYNGARHLPAQLESLLSQTIPAQIVIRDDGSRDETIEILNRYQNIHPDRIKIIKKNDTHSGASHNFSCLLESATGDYILFADQDDVWDADKVEISLREMQRIESLSEEETPVLLHTDLRVVDTDLQPISPSLFAFQGLDKSRSGLIDLLSQNIVTGCTVMLNRTLYSMATPVPEEAIMHDWWIALIAAGRGRIGIVNRSTVSYRQHNQNTLGAQAFGLAMWRRYSSRLISREGCASLVFPLSRQAKAFLRVHGKFLEPLDLQATEAVSRIPESSCIKRLLTIFRFGIRKHSPLKQIAFIWMVLAAKNGHTQ